MLAKNNDNNDNNDTRVTAGFQDSDIFQRAIKNGVEMHFECDFTPFRIKL